MWCVVIVAEMGFESLNKSRCGVRRVEVGKWKRRWKERSVEVVLYIQDRTQKGSRRLRESVYERYCRGWFWEASESTF